MICRIKRRDPEEEILNFMQKVHKHAFGGWIEETMEYSEEYIDDAIEDQTIQSTLYAPTITQIIPQISPVPPTKKKVNSFNVEAFHKINVNKKKEIKEKLIKSLIIKYKTILIKENSINFNSLDEMMKYLKICEQNILIIHKKEIYYYVLMGEIIHHIKIMFPSNWKSILKENNINYTKEYFNFLIRLHKLFNENKILYKTTLSLSFFKKNYTLIKEIVKEGIEMLPL